ncbi:hypothetical protein NKG94_40535 [Micromonospora sp. M12]
MPAHRPKHPQAGVGHAKVGAEDVDAGLSPFPPIIGKSGHSVNARQAYGRFLRPELLGCLGEAFVEQADTVAVSLDLCPFVGRLSESLSDFGTQVSSVRQLVSEFRQRVRVLRYPLPTVGDHQGGDTTDARHNGEDELQEVEQRGRCDGYAPLKARPTGEAERRSNQDPDQQQRSCDSQSD